MWRADFPIFQEMSNVAFLDSAASAQKPLAVLQKMQDVQTQHYANIHRGLYAWSQESTADYESARAKVARFMNAPSPNDIVFTKNATESINLVAQTWGKQQLESGDEIILTMLEHHANIVPWQLLAEEIGFTIKVADIEDDGSLPVENVLNLITSKTKLIACTALSNALGTVVDVQSICQYAKEQGVTTLVDASQAMVHTPLDVQTLLADFVVWTGHKLYGPTGVGVLWANNELLNALPPYQGGGDMIETVSFKGTTFANAPARFEAGTPNIVNAIGLGAAVDYVMKHDQEAVQDYEQELFAYLKESLQNINGVTCYTPEHQLAVMSFTLDGIHTHDAAVILDNCHVACRTGHHCAMPLMERLGISGTIRASIAPYNVKQDIDKLIEAVEKSIKMLG